MASSGNATTPFFGSKISLISKSEIRYEGLLYAIDAKESTIALAKVKSFGSEDRPVDRPVPPRDDIFQLIIFRASDIKDLIVDDPTPQSTATALADPAIVQAHPSSTTSFPSSFPQPSSITQAQRAGNKSEPQQQSQPASSTGGEPKAKNAASVLHGLNKLTQQQTKQHAQAQAVATAGGGGGASRVSKPHAQHAQHAQPQQPPQLSTQPHPPRANQNVRRNQAQLSGPGLNVAGGGERNREYQPRNNGGGGGFRSYNAVAGGAPNRADADRGQQRTYSGARPHAAGYNNNNGNRGGPRPGNFRNPGGYRPVYGGLDGALSRNPGIKFSSQPLPDTDFDFEKAQDEFKLLEEQLSELKVNGSNEEDDAADLEVAGGDEPDKDDPSKEPAYNKTKSFFDTISCEALEREKGPIQRPDWKNERKMNRETFGLISQPRSNYYNRGNNRYGGGGFRPNFRRPGGYQNRMGGGGGLGGGNGRPNQRFGGQNGQQQQQPSSTTNGNVEKPQAKTNGVSSSTNSNAATTAAILAAVTGGVVSPPKN